MPSEPEMPAAVNLFQQAEEIALAEKGLQPGFLFDARAYPALAEYRKVDDLILPADKGCVRQYFEFVKGKSEVRVNISVHSGSIKAARAEFVKYILVSAMLPQTGYVLKPGGFGDFHILYADEAAAQKPHTINFMRSNVGVTVWKLRGALDVPDLARHIDARIEEQKPLKNVLPLCPQGLKASLSRTELEVGDIVECSASFEKKEGETYKVFFSRDNRLLTEVAGGEAQETWQATAPGVSPIVVMVCDSKLLTSTVELGVKILGEEKEPGEEEEE